MGFQVLLFLYIGQEAKAQIYSTHYRAGTVSLVLNYYDATTNTWTAKANIPSFNQAAGADLVYNNNFLYTTEPSNGKLYQYTIATDTWTEKATAPASDNVGLVSDGTYLYAINPSTSTLYQYNVATNTWATKSNAPIGGIRSLAYDGTYLYAINFAGALVQYTISTDTWVTKATTPSPGNVGPLVYDGTYLYAVDNGTDVFYRYDSSTNTWLAAGSMPTASAVALTSDGTYIYTSDYDSGAFYQYDINTNTWTAKANDLSIYTSGLAYAGIICAPPSFTATATQVTCSGPIANSNGTLTLSAFDSKAKAVGFSIGSTYTGPAFGSATTISGSAPFTVTNTLANPTTPQPYTIRVFCDATHFKDVALILQPKVCKNADLSLTVSPATASGSQGELLTYTVTLTNAGPDAANVKVRVPIPGNGTFLSANPQQGSYNAVSQKWDVGNVPVGSKTMTFTLKVN